MRDVDCEVGLAERATSVDLEPLADAFGVVVMPAFQVLHLVGHLELDAAN